MFNKVLFYMLVMSEYLQLFQRIIAVCNKYATSLPQLATFISRLNEAAEVLEEANQKIRANSLTATLADLDKERDRAFLHFRYSIQAALYSAGSRDRHAAKEIELFIRELDWSMQAKGYLQQTALFNSMLNGLKNHSKVASAMEALNFLPMAEDIQNQQTAFEKAEAERNTELSKKSEATAEGAYPLMRSAFERFTRYVEVMYDLEQTPEYLDMSKEINEIIDDIMAQAKARATRRENAEETVNESLQN